MSRAISRPAAGLLLAALSLVALVSSASAKEAEIFLPADCDAVTIKGEGFSIKFEEIKRNWEQVSHESAQVETPRPQPGDNAGDAHEAAAPGSPEAGAASEQVVVNKDLFEKAQGEAPAGQDYGLVDDELLEWIGARATALMNKVERYSREAATVREANRIVIDIMLLNTLVDLDNLNKEEIAKLKWVKNKLKKILADFIHEQASADEVMTYTKMLIDTSKAIELKVRNSNDPGKAWVTNAQALTRILHEQRYSEELGNIIVEFLAGQFNMMKRSVVYQINRRAKSLDDGLYYVYASGRVPANFPFSAQDALSRGES